MQFIETGRIRLCVSVQGRGPRLLFVGGTGWDLRQQPNPLTSPLTQHFTLALFDQRGMGQSGKPDGPYSMRDYALDAVALMDALEWPCAHIVGYSFGGMVAQEIAIHFPERLDRLVLAASSPGGAGGASFPIETLFGLPPLERARRGLEVADKRFTPEFQKQNPELAADMITKRAQAQSAFAHEDRATEGLKAQLAARAGHDCFDRLSDISAKTLVLAGKFDGQADLEVQRNMASKMQNARFAEINGAHGFLFETHEAYEKMVDFLLD